MCHPIRDSVFSMPISINKHFRKVLDNSFTGTGFPFLMTYTTLPGISATNSLTVQHLEKFKTPKGELKYIYPPTSCPASEPAADAFVELEVNITYY